GVRRFSRVVIVVLVVGPGRFPARNLRRLTAGATAERSVGAISRLRARRRRPPGLRANPCDYASFRRALPRRTPRPGTRRAGARNKSRPPFVLRDKDPVSIEERRAQAMPDDANFEQLYRSHYRRVHGLCRQLLGSTASADDAAQEAFIRAYRAFDRYDATQPFAGWIMSIATRYCIDVVRRRATETRLFDDKDVELVEFESNEAAALDTLITSERADELKEAIASLPDKQRIPLVLAYYEE